MAGRPIIKPVIDEIARDLNIISFSKGSFNKDTSRLMVQFIPGAFMYLPISQSKNS
jgi:hypothetical protein